MAATGEGVGHMLEGVGLVLQGKVAGVEGIVHGDHPFQAAITPSRRPSSERRRASKPPICWSF